MVSPLKNKQLVFDMNQKIRAQGWSLLPRDTTPAKAIVKYGGKGLDNVNELEILDYQNNELKEALTHVNKFDVAIDAGANYGFFTLHLKKFKEVHAFEIFTPVRECLEKNVETFNMSNTTVYSCGLGDENKWVHIDPGMGTFSTHVAPKSKDGKFEIRTIDSFRLEACDFIKIDCEGYESFILDGAKETIDKFQPIILMENKGHSERYGVDREVPVAKLIEWGYEILISYRKDVIMGPKHVRRLNGGS